MKLKHLILSQEKNNKILRIKINRPEVRNAFNEELILDFYTLFHALNERVEPSLRGTRVVVLQGEGPAFCGGGDLKWMKRSMELSHEENLEDCRKLTRMFHTMDLCPVPVVGMIHGYAIGGGVGLVSICDHVCAEEQTIFSLSEVKLGLIPACIGPFVIAKIGVSQARSFFVSGERFKTDRAMKINLVHESCKLDEMEERAQKICERILEGGPHAIQAAKFLVQSLSRDLIREDFAKSLDFAAAELAQLRVQPEAQEGFKAFFEKRAPNWKD